MVRLSLLLFRLVVEPVLDKSFCLSTKSKLYDNFSLKKAVQIFSPTIYFRMSLNCPSNIFLFLSSPFQYRLTTSNCSLPLFHQQRIELPLINNDFIRISSDTRNNYAKDIHTKSNNGKARKTLEIIIVVTK